MENDNNEREAIYFLLRLVSGKVSTAMMMVVAIIMLFAKGHPFWAVLYILLTIGLFLAPKTYDAESNTINNPLYYTRMIVFILSFIISTSI